MCGETASALDRVVRVCFSRQWEMNPVRERTGCDARVVAMATDPSQMTRAG